MHKLSHRAGLLHRGIGYRVPRIPYYFTSASAGSGTTQVPGIGDDGYTQGAAPNTWSAESKTVTPSDFGLGWTRTAATADTGMLKSWAWAQASSTAPSFPSGGGGSGSANARYQDSFVVHSGQYADGTVATLTARILIDGTMPVTTQGGFWSSTQSWSWNFGLAGLDWSEGTSIFGDATNGFRTVGNGFGYRTYTANIVLGQDVSTTMNIATGISVNAGGYGGSFVEAASDLGHTVTWRGISSLSVNGVDVTDFSAVSATSGFDFRRGIVETAGGVPEPQSWMLLIAGFGLVGAAMRRRQWQLAT